MEILHYLLVQIRKAPYMYLGARSLTRLGFYLSGAIDTLAVLTGNFVDVAPAGFSQFIQERFHSDGSLSDFAVILQNSENDSEALDTFYALLDEFLALNEMDYTMPEDTKGNILGIYNGLGDLYESEALRMYNGPLESHKTEEQ